MQQTRAELHRPLGHELSLVDHTFTVVGILKVRDRKKEDLRFLYATGRHAYPVIKNWGPRGWERRVTGLWPALSSGSCNLFEGDWMKKPSRPSVGRGEGDREGLGPPSPYRDIMVQRLAIHPLILCSDIQEVELASRHHDANQSPVFCSCSLKSHADKYTHGASHPPTFRGPSPPMNLLRSAPCDPLRPRIL